jgi:YegS/Rv2252/BmrU family lipid kinase
MTAGDLRTQKVLQHSGRKRALIIINASSGWDAKEDAPERLKHWFEDSGIDARIEYVAKGTNLAQMSREAVAGGYDIVVAGGGDGTLSAVASGLAATDVAFGVLPVGTLNHFARDLSLPLDLEPAARIVCGGHTTHVDVAEVNGKTFLNNSIIGLYPVFRFLRAEQERKGMPRKLALLWAALSVFRRFPFFKLRFILNGRTETRKTPYVLIANNEHAMQGWQLGARRCLCEGKLYIYVMRPQSRLGLLGMLLKVVLGRFDAREHFDIFSAEEVWIETRSKRVGVALDGEVTVLESPLRYRILPVALRVIVPKPE